MKKILVLAIWLVLFLYVGCSSTGGKHQSLSSKIPPADKLVGTVMLLESVAPSSVQANTKNVPLVSFAMASNQSGVSLKSLKFEQTGTIKDSDIERIKLYFDNGDEIFEPTKDILLASAQLKNDLCEFKLDQPVIKKPQLFFIAVDFAPSANGSVSFQFSEDSFGTTDIAGVTGTRFPFTASASISSGEKKAEPFPTKPVAAKASRQGEIPYPTDSKGIVSELEKEKSIKMQENEFLAQKYYETALKLFKEFNYDQARDSVERALQLNPTHQDAKKLSYEIQLILGSRPGEIQVIKEFYQQQLAVKIQETEIVVRNHFLNGERLIAEKKYGEAQLEFEAVVNKLRYVPYEIGLKDYLTKSQERLIQIKDMIAQEEEQVIRQRREAAALISQEEETKRQQEYNEKIRSLFKEALVFFEQKRFQETERLADTILGMAPNFQAAAELKKEAIRARHYEVSESYLQLRSERLKGLLDEFKETIIPYADDKVVRYDKEVWDVASKRQSSGTISSTKEEEDVDILEIKRKLKTIKHDFKLDGTMSLYDVTGFLQQQYKIPIIYASEIRQEGSPNDKKTLSLVGLPLEIGLRNLLELYNLSYTFNRDFKCLWITRLTALEEELVWRVHNVDDLVRPIVDFPGPNIELALTPGGAPGWTPPTAGAEATPPLFPIEDVIDMIKKNTGKDRRGGSTWDANIPGVTIRKIGDSNKLMVVHTPAVQDEVVEFLKILRSFRSTMVVIETTFLATSDNNLEDFGVQLRDIPRTPIANAPTIPGQTQPGAGITPGGSRDIRFRTAYTFRDANGAIETALPAADVGGLGLQFSVVRKQRVNMLINALEKSGKGNILDSPKVVALNGQRVNVSFLKQRNYIQDADIQSGAIAYQPIINTFSTGVVLDVKPVVSYDRKYITVFVFPTLLELIDVRQLPLQFEYLPEGIVTSITVELPWMRLQRCRTSAIIPDKGALILGGLKTITTNNITASTPFFDKIPIIQAFFRRKITNEERNNQLIVLRAEIIELPEIEQSIQ